MSTDQPTLADQQVAVRQQLVQALATLVNAGVLTADQDLEEFVRAAIGIPARDPSRPIPVREDA